MDSKICAGCDRLLPFSSFYKSKGKKHGLNHQCKDCCRAYSITHRVRINLRAKRLRKSRKQIFKEAECKTCGSIFRPMSSVNTYCCVQCRVRSPRSKEYSKQQRKQYSEKGLCVVCTKPIDGSPSKTRCAGCAAINRTTVREYYRNLRLEVLDMYGGKCVCCGETETAFLTLDHINNDGAAHRRMGKTGPALYTLVKNKRPTDIQILCYNCNCAKGHYGMCPHEKMRFNERGEKRQISHQEFICAEV